MPLKRSRTERKTCNIIIHGVAEDQADDGEDEKKYVATLFENMCTVYGLTSRNDPLKYPLQTRKKKNLVLRSLVK